MCPKLVSAINNRKTSIQGLLVTTAVLTLSHSGRGKSLVKGYSLKCPEPRAYGESMGLALILSWRPEGYIFKKSPQVYE